MKKQIKPTVKAMAAFAILACAGCKQDYSDPEAFLKEYIVDKEAKSFCSDARMKELRFSGIKMSDVRVSTEYGMSVVCAKLRFVPESDKIAYAQILRDYRRPGDFVGIEMLSGEKLDAVLSAEVKVPRVKMDNGIYAPANMENNSKHISGWGRVGSLSIATDELIAADKRFRDGLTEAKNAVFNDMAKRGGDLSKAIDFANVDRMAKGKPALWPSTTRRNPVSGDDEDISDMAFRNAGSYFRALFDLPGKENPYIYASPRVAFENDSARGSVLWSVAADIDDSISDNAPILISSNFNCSILPEKWPCPGCDADKKIPIGWSPIIGNSCVVYVTKGGKTCVLPAEKVTLRNICGGADMKLPPRFLTGVGIVNTRK